MKNSFYSSWLENNSSSHKHKAMFLLRAFLIATINSGTMGFSEDLTATERKKLTINLRVSSSESLSQVYRSRAGSVYFWKSWFSVIGESLKMLRVSRMKL